MALMDILNHRFFSARYKLPIHIVEVILVIIAMGLSVPRLFMKNQPRTRANTIALGMGAKSLMFLAYQLLTDHVARFQRWRSYKAYAILNGLEIVFWGAVMFLIMRANMKNCNGIGCYLSWGVLGVAAVLNQMYVYMFLVTLREFREHKAQGAFEKTRSADSSEIPMYQQQQRQGQTSPEPLVKPAYAHQELGRGGSGGRGYGQTRGRY